MGLLAEGTPLSWKDSLPFHDKVKTRGLKQFLNTYHRLKDRSNDEFLWGDEVEYLLLRVDNKKKTAKVLLEGADIIRRLKEDSKNGHSTNALSATFHPEYAQFMIETTPGRPYGGFTAHIPLVEQNMILRRHLIQQQLSSSDRVVSMTSFPLLGVPDCTSPALPPGGPATMSRYVPDGVINPHPRFPCLTANIRERRGSNVCIKVPLFIDTHTPSAPGNETPVDVSDPADITSDTPNIIHMDAMAFGMGCCCLQVTFQCRNIREARHLYDQLSVLSPIMLALSAATPFFKGKVADTDVRWSVISQSVDDRTPAEKGLENLRAGEKLIHKSRYDSIDSYLSLEESMHEKYNDVEIVYDEKHLQTLLDGGVDRLLAQHIAHLFVRDPLVVFKENIDQDDHIGNDHFENLQSTNWQTVRFKPPTINDVGWRVEFRSMEVQITDFENAAYTVFVALLSRAIMFLDLNLYIPISKSDENMARAHCRDSVNTQKFHFRMHTKQCSSIVGDPDAHQEMTIHEIMCGKDPYFPGLIAIVEAYLDVIQCDVSSRKLIEEYLNFIELRSSGELMTTAKWMRRFMNAHPDYEHDSNLPASSVLDLVETCSALAGGAIAAPQLLPNLASEHAAILATSSHAARTPKTSGVPLTIDLSSAAGQPNSVCSVLKAAFRRRRRSS